METTSEDFKWDDLSSFVNHPLVQERGWTNKDLESLFSLGVLSGRINDSGEITTCIFNLKRIIYSIKLSEVIGTAMRNNPGKVKPFKFDEIILRYLCGEDLISTFSIVPGE